MLLVCLPVHLCVNKHPLEYFYLCNFVRESKEARDRERGGEKDTERELVNKILKSNVINRHTCTYQTSSSYIP